MGPFVFWLGGKRRNAWIALNKNPAAMKFCSTFGGGVKKVILIH